MTRGEAAQEGGRQMDAKETVDTVGAVNPMTRGEAADRSAGMSEQKTGGQVDEQVDAVGELLSSLHAEVRDLALLDGGSDAERLTKLKDVLCGVLDEIHDLEADEELEIARTEAYEAREALMVDIMNAISRLAALYEKVRALKIQEVEDDEEALWDVKLMLQPTDKAKDTHELAYDLSDKAASEPVGTLIGWAIADAEARVAYLEEAFAKPVEAVQA